ncbi:hypothetical protein [Agriterribacter sp.]|uniref:hypothetical protein n=1 Tax=Agriterribacter sp. TaxID=2821509 RepID=UPI002D15A8F8|nr:hypothetical protein [Agriterribacter sp.]HRP55504.1 hypothetical protein [Agriterribacter sp.]
MYSYALLEKECYYLIEEKEGAPIVLIRIMLESDHCLFITRYGETEITEWKRKSDPIFEIIELLDDKAVKEWESSYYNNEDAYYEDDD